MVVVRNTLISQYIVMEGDHREPPERKEKEVTMLVGDFDIIHNMYAGLC